MIGIHQGTVLYCDSHKLFYLKKLNQFSSQTKVFTSFICLLVQMVRTWAIEMLQEICYGLKVSCLHREESRNKTKQSHIFNKATWL